VMDALKHIYIFESAAIPNVHTWLDGGVLASSDIVACCVRDGHRYYLLGMLRVEALLAQLKIQKDHRVAHVVDDLLSVFLHALFVFVSGAHRFGLLAPYGVLKSSLRVLAPDSVDPLEPQLELIWYLCVVARRHRVEPVGDQGLQSSVQPCPEIR